MNIDENNTLKKEIEEILILCDKAIEKYGEKASFFGKPISEEEMNEWEKNNNVKIPFVNTYPLNGDQTEY